MRSPTPRARPLLAIGLASLLLLQTLPHEAHADTWWGQDKALHLLVGLGIGATCYGGLFALNSDEDPPALRAALCASFGQLPGLGKEIYDAGRPHNAFSAKDLFWTSLGVLISVFTGWLIERLTTRSHPDHSLLLGPGPTWHF